MDRLAPLRDATPPAARQRPLPDAENFGGEVSLDHLVGAREQRGRYFDAQRPRAASSLVDRWNSTRPLTVTAALAPDACRRRRMGGRGRASSLRDSYASPVRPLPFCSAVQLPL